LVRFAVENKLLTEAMVSKSCAPCKGGDFQWVQFPPGDGSLQPVAIGAAEEVTSPSKPLMKRIALGDSANMQAET
jgi:hypothetical protein